ncbi:MAG TPA: hypothetical protein VKA84_06720 [Gemmatimonadaceae bacterium]|nr:hypothetical protein [Gemmatimonadaceae bacterium]
MHISFALFADAANLSQEGKLNILGVFDTVQVGALPAIHPRANLVVRLKGNRADAGTHTLMLRWTNPRGEELWSSAGELSIAPPPPGVTEMDFPLIAAIDLPIDQAGAFRMSIDLDASTKVELPVQVRAAGTSGGGPPTGPGSPIMPGARMVS